MVTILYYTSNREDENFEQKIQENIAQRCGRLPIVSVSQRPINFGENICIGEHANSYYTEFRQIQVGLRAITTPWVLVAEADCLYPDEYFKFPTPGEETHYRYNNVWIHFSLKRPRWYYFKHYSDGAQLINREWWLAVIDSKIGKTGPWETAERFYTAPIVPKSEDGGEWGGSAVISFKTHRGVNFRTGLHLVNGNEKVKTRELPYWGSAQKLFETYL